MDRSIILTGPAHSGVFIYSENISALVDFYLPLFQLTKIHERDNLIVCNGNHIQIVFHQIPQNNHSPVKSDDDIRYRAMPIKLFFTVPSLIDAKQKIVELGGDVLPEEYVTENFTAMNVIDIDKNIIQIRELKS